MVVTALPDRVTLAAVEPAFSAKRPAALCDLKTPLAALRLHRDSLDRSLECATEQRARASKLINGPNESYGGLGFGPYVARQTARAHGRRQRREDALTPSLPDQSRRTAEMRCKTILIVEDDKDIRDALRLTLELERYSVLIAANGREALAILSELPSPCLILLDLMMPVMDGWAFAEAIERDRTLAANPIIVVTAFAEQAKAVKNARGIIKKPVNIDLMMKVAREYCDGAPEG